MDKQTRKGYVKMAKRKTSFTIYPTYSDIFKNGQEEILAHLSTEGVAEKYIVFTTSLSASLYASHIKGMHVQEKKYRTVHRKRSRTSLTF
jgi:hypothetical protein